MLPTKPYIGFVCCLMIILQYVDACTMAAQSIQHSPLDSLDSLDEPAECLIKHSKTLDECQSPISAYAYGDQRQFYPYMCCSLFQYEQCLEGMAKILCGDNATHLILEEKGILSHLDRCNGYENINECNKVKRSADIGLAEPIIELFDCFATHYQEFEECDQEFGEYETGYVQEDITRFVCCPVARKQRSCYEQTARELCSQKAVEMLKNGLEVLYYMLDFLGKDCNDVNCR